MARSDAARHKKPAIALCMIVRNEATRLAQCIGSVRPLVQEMVVVDTGSTDDTPALAGRLGARVYPFAWQEDFAAARNFALQQVQSDWVLVLDGDERLLPPAIPALRRLMRQPNLLAVILRRQELGATQSPYSAVTRFFRRHPALQFHGIYHESIDDSVAALQAQEPHWQVAHLEPTAIKHYGYHPLYTDLVAKAQRAERLLQSHLQKFPQDAYALAKLGALCLSQDQLPAALEHLEQAVALADPRPAVRFESLYHLALVQEARADRPAAQALYEAAIALPLHPLVLLPAQFNLALLSQETGAMAKAIALLTQVVAPPPDYLPAYLALGQAYKITGNLTAAIATYERAIAQDPSDPEPYRNLGVALFHKGQSHLAQQAWQRAIEAYRFQGKTENARELKDRLQELGLLARDW
ncbi:MAG: glycosyltransferase [Oscillatoriales cyanobacterium SM2_1_8]|nr:glycosyltransferase [Oscillatoriales cyanobacterium SM2_1_8]